MAFIPGWIGVTNNRSNYNIVKHGLCSCTLDQNHYLYLPPPPPRSLSLCLSLAPPPPHTHTHTHTHKGMWQRDYWSLFSEEEDNMLDKDSLVLVFCSG